MGINVGVTYLNCLNVRSLIDTKIASFSGQGDVVFREIKIFFDKNEKVVLSFKDMELITPTFLNAAIGQLYGIYPRHKIKELLSVDDIEDDDLYIIKRVVDNAIEFFKRRNVYERNQIPSQDNQ